MRGIATALQRVLNKRPVRVIRFDRGRRWVAAAPTIEADAKTAPTDGSVPPRFIPSSHLHDVQNGLLAVLEVIKRNGAFFQITLVVECDMADYPVVIGGR